MDSSTFTSFRGAIYGCFGNAADALMNVVDALLTETQARSLAELSLSPFFERRWPSLYEAFQDAQIDRTALQKVFLQYGPQPPARERLVIGGDASSILRPQSKTAEDRTYVHVSNAPQGSKPVSPGWQFSQLAILADEVSSWVYVLDNQRIPSTKTQGEVMAEQLRQTTPLLPKRPLFLGDGYYGSEIFRGLVAEVPCDVLVRYACNRKLYRQPPPVIGEVGAGHPTWHGAVLKLADPKTHGTPDQSFDGIDAHDHRLEVHCWQNLHFQKWHLLPVCLYQVIRHGAEGTKRDPKVSWFVFWGKTPPLPEEIPVLYARRYHIEHGYRVAKQDLLWEKPRLRTPDQFSRWTDVVSIVRNLLYLARDLVGGFRQPWANADRPDTPEQVRHGMWRILLELGTPARLSQPRGKSSGWPIGQIRRPSKTYKVVFKGGVKLPKGAKPPSTGFSGASLAV